MNTKVSDMRKPFQSVRGRETASVHTALTPPPQLRRLVFEPAAFM